jgi:hypothetical protein
MSSFKVGDKVKLKTPSRDSALVKWLGGGRVYTVNEVHEGNSHTPEQMITLVGTGGVMLYSWRFEKAED